jgi:2-polyprenyl-3-methyl-5-hydroxy-6-metoxy-1,4-benzoquinol methylase
MARRGAKITGIDYSKKLIKIAREKADKESLAINFIESDIEKVDLGKRKYDGIIIGMGIGYIRNVGKLLGEIAKHLKINGWIIISTNHPIRESGEYIKDKEGNIGRTVFTYFSKKPRMVEWKHMQSITGKKFEVPIYPHSIEEIVSALFNSSIYITNIFEPRPSKNNLCESELIKRMACCQQFIIYRGIKVRM